MSEIIIGQVRFLLMTSLLGMVLMGAYDVCRFVRWLIPHHAAAVAMEDILFWVLASIPAYALFFFYNDGEIRWYGALAVLLGGLLYEKGISLPVRRLGDRYLSIPRRKIIRFLGRIKRRGMGRIKKVFQKIKSKSMERKQIEQENKKKKMTKKRKNKLQNLAK